MAYESTWHRASVDTEHFRSKRFWFWGVEVIGAGAIASLTAGILWGRSILSAWQVGLITLGFFAIGFLIIYALIFLWNLFRAPYKQRNEARASLDKVRKWESFLKNIKKGDTVTDKIINVPLLFQLQRVNTLASITFVRCTFIGPCSIRIDCDSEVKGADFQGKLDEHFIELNREGTYIGLVRFAFCKFEYPRFENISIVGFKSTYDKINENSVQL